MRRQRQREPKTAVSVAACSAEARTGTSTRSIRIPVAATGPTRAQAGIPTAVVVGHLRTPPANRAGGVFRRSQGQRYDGMQDRQGESGVVKSNAGWRPRSPGSLASMARACLCLSRADPAGQQSAALLWSAMAPWHTDLEKTYTGRLSSPQPVSQDGTDCLRPQAGHLSVPTRPVRAGLVYVRHGKGCWSRRTPDQSQPRSHRRARRDVQTTLRRRSHPAAGTKAPSSRSTSTLGAPPMGRGQASTRTRQVRAPADSRRRRRPVVLPTQKQAWHGHSTTPEGARRLANTVSGPGATSAEQWGIATDPEHVYAVLPTPTRLMVA